MTLDKFALLLTASCLVMPVVAQGTAPTAAAVEIAEDEGTAIIVTGSRIRRNPNDSSLPLQVITNEEFSREGISNPEQLLMFLSTNGSGADNLASNADVTSGAQRGTNGLSAANLRGQGSASTLVLLNSRRVAAHGLSGSAVDVNQIPFAAIERVEVLKDGASAIYGTDAIGGVINFITKKDFTGLSLSGFVDATEEGDGNIYRLSGVAGYGDLDDQGFNLMGAVSYSWNKILRGSDRNFVNGNQPNRGLSIDTRGTPIATVFNIGANPIQTAGGTLLTGLTITAPNGANAVTGGINPLDVPGGAGCDSVDGGLAYDEVLWAVPSAFYACAWDTGRAAVIQQPIQTLTYYGRAVGRVAEDHEISFEVTGSNADSAKSFSNAQLSANATNLPWAYPRNALTAATYDSVVNSIRSAITNPAQLAAFNTRAALNLPISGRWRCIACGPREYETTTETFRAALGIEGPIVGGWDYRAGASYAKSESSSLLGSGYYFRGTLGNGAYDPLAPQVAGAPAGFRGLVGAINSGLLNPFSTTQTDAGLAALESISAEGTTLYGGQYEVKQLDYSVSGPLFDIWGGTVQAAIGIDYRKETYSFNGSAAASAAAPVIFLAAFDNINQLTPKNRDVKAAYAEILVPLFEGLEITGAVRADDYSSFGTTVNPKVSFKYRPWDPIMLRGSYNTGFRVPAFNQLFNGITLSPNPGNALVDTTTCPVGGTINVTPGCAAINPDSFSGGNLDLRPETSEQYSFGIVFQPSSRFSASVDYWSIAVDDVIGAFTLTELLSRANSPFATQQLLRNAAGTIVLADLRSTNTGSRRTEGLEVMLRGGIDAMGGILSAGLDGTYLLKKKVKLFEPAPYVSELGVFSFAGDLGLKWKHNAFVSYQNDDISLTLSQIFRDGYKNQALPGSAARPDFNERVSRYIIYNATVGFVGIPGIKLVAGVKNIFDKDPPFAISYDSNTGAGGSWEPRVADPRGRSFTLSVETKF